MSLRGWASIETGRFRFARREPHRVAHDPRRRGHVAFLRPGQPVPAGWRPGRPPAMSVEEWVPWAQAEDQALGRP